MTPDTYRLSGVIWVIEPIMFNRIEKYDDLASKIIKSNPKSLQELNKIIPQNSLLLLTIGNYLELEIEQ